MCQYFEYVVHVNDDLIRLLLWIGPLGSRKAIGEFKIAMGNVLNVAWLPSYFPLALRHGEFVDFANSRGRSRFSQIARTAARLSRRKGG